MSKSISINGLITRSAKDVIDHLEQFEIGKPISMRKWQKEEDKFYLENLNRNINIITPTGSGKSIAIQSNVLHFLEKNSDKKVIISAPTKAIAGGFSGTKIIKHKNRNREFSISSKYDLSKDGLSDNSKKHTALQFLENNNFVTISDRICLCTHATLVHVYQYLKNKDKRKLLNGAALFIDEAHHSQLSEYESNGLGNVVEYCLKNNIRIGKGTATYFRGDSLSIIPQKYEHLFETYKLPYDRHFDENCNGIGFRYDARITTEDWIEDIKYLFKEKVGKTIVFVPHPNQKASGIYSKGHNVERIIQAIAGRKNFKDFSDWEGYYFIRNDSGQMIKIVDLVEERGRQERVEELRNNPDEYDVVLGINVPKEGFDWTAADRGIIIDSVNSLTMMVQMMGRLFRYHPNKKETEIIQIFPNVDESKVDDKTYHKANSFMKAVYCALIIEPVLQPENFYVKTKNTSKTKKQKKTDVWNINDVLTVNEIQDLQEDIFNGLANYQDTHPEIEDMTVEETDEVYTQVILNIVKNQPKIAEYQEEVAELIFNQWKRRSSELSLNRGGLYANDIQADLIKEGDPLGCFKLFSNVYCNSKDLRGFRKLLNHTNLWTLEQIKLKIDILGYNSVSDYINNWEKDELASYWTFLELCRQQNIIPTNLFGRRIGDWTLNELIEKIRKFGYQTLSDYKRNSKKDGLPNWNVLRKCCQENNISLKYPFGNDRDWKKIKMEIDNVDFSNLSDYKKLSRRSDIFPDLSTVKKHCSEIGVCYLKFLNIEKKKKWTNEEIIKILDSKKYKSLQECFQDRENTKLPVNLRKYLTESEFKNYFPWRATNTTTLEECREACFKYKWTNGRKYREGCVGKNVPSMNCLRNTCKNNHLTVKQFFVEIRNAI